MSKFNLENLTDEIEDGDDNDAPITSFKLTTSIPKNTSKSVGSLPSSSMTLPTTNNLPPAIPKPTDRVETLEEKIARVMAGINMPKALPPKSPTNLPTASPFEKFSLATKSTTKSPSPVISQESPSNAPTPTNTSDQEPPTERRRSGARIVRPGSNNSLSSLTADEKVENNISKSSPVISTQSPSNTPALLSPTETEKGKKFEERDSVLSPPSGDSTPSLARGIALPSEVSKESDQAPNEPILVAESLDETKPATKTVKGGKIVRGESPSRPTELTSPSTIPIKSPEPELSTPSTIPIQSPEPEPSTIPIKSPEPELSTERISDQPTTANISAPPSILDLGRSSNVHEDEQDQPDTEETEEEQNFDEKEIDPDRNTQQGNPLPEITAIREERENPQSPNITAAAAATSVIVHDTHEENRGRAKDPIVQSQQTQNVSPTSVSQKTAKIVRPTPSNPAPTHTPNIVRSKSQERTRTPSGNSVGSRAKVPTTPSFTPQQRRIPELPSALSTVGFSATPETSHVGHHNRSQEWSISKRTETQSVSSYPLTIPRFNHQLSNMFPEHQAHEVKVAVRIRPFTIGEIQSGPRRVVSVNGDKLILVNPNAFDANPDAIAAAAAAVSLENMRCNDWAKVFCFDNCFWSYDPTDEGDTYVDQQGIFEVIGSSIGDDILRGISTCCFAYGHTSTGKTYTMFGGDDLINSRNKDSFIEFENNNGDLQLHPSAGLIPRVFMDILNRVFADSEVLQDTKVTLSFIEIYQEKIRDCLSPINNSAELRVREHPALGPYVENLTRVEVESVRDVLELLYHGYEERSTASTLRNRHSSRSHAIATLELSPADAQDPFAPNSTRKSTSSIPQPVHIQKHAHVRCQMVDLAGSEKEFDAEPETPSKRRNSGEAIANEKLELKMIRRSLSTLGYIIKALGQGNSPKGLPFRDSVLTWLLKDAFSGQSKTTMLATISPSHTCYDETLQTLKYAERLCQIAPSAKPGMESTGRVSIHDTIDPELSYTLANEYTKLKHELGGNKPGSVAAKHLLQQTISDPQQRLARLDPYRGGYIEDDARYQSNSSRNDDRYSMVPSSAKKQGRAVLSQSHNGSLLGSNDILIEQDLKEAYRQLHGKYVELQIELENTRTDRDSMKLDVKKLQESLERSESEKYLGSKSALNDMTLALRSAEAEVNELRGILLRKEETADRLLGELADERQARETVEKTARAQVTELINRLETLHRQGQIALKESHNWQQEANILKQEKELLQTQLQSYKELMNEKTEEFTKKIYSLEDELKLSMEHVNTVIKERDRTNSEITLILKEKAEMAAREVTLTQRIQELILEVEKVQNESKLKSELEIIKLQRDSLFEMIKQQENALQLQQKQSEKSLKMLHQRQAALDKYEQKYYHENDELNILQENLQKLLNYEGELLQNEVIDAKKLLKIINEIKEKIHENNYFMENIQKLEIEKNEYYLKYHEIERKYENILQEYQQCCEQLEHSKKLTIDWETRAHYWQQVSKKTTINDRRSNLDSTAPTSTTTTAMGTGISLANAVNSLDSNELKSENIRLQELLNSTQKELETSKYEFENSKNEMQKEFSSLWLAVEQLNKLDASKDKTIRDLTHERDHARQECKELLKKFNEMKKEYDGLQSELQSIDLNLLDVADHEGIEVSDILNVVHDHHPHVNNVTKNSISLRSDHTKSPHHKGGAAAGGGHSGSGGLYSSYNDPFRETLRERDSDIVSEPGYFRSTQSRERHISSRGEKRSINNQRRERSVSPASSRRRTQVYSNNEKGLEMQIEELSQYLNRDSSTRSRSKLRASREY